MVLISTGILLIKYYSKQYLGFDHYKTVFQTIYINKPKQQKYHRPKLEKKSMRYSFIHKSNLNPHNRPIKFKADLNKTSQILSNSFKDLKYSEFIEKEVNFIIIYRKNQRIITYQKPMQIYIIKNIIKFLCASQGQNSIIEKLIIKRM